MTPDPRQLDALRELANIGGGNAATALSKLLRREIAVEVPSVELTRAAQLAERVGGPDAEIVCVTLELRGEAGGTLVLLLPRETGAALVSRLTGSLPRAPAEPFDEAAKSAISETGNILASTYLNAIGRASGSTMMLSTPRFEEGIAGSLLERRLGTRELLLVLTRFSEPHEGAGGDFLVGHFVVAPELGSLAKLLEGFSAPRR